MIRLALAFSLIASAASAQGLSQARDTFAGFQGDWAEPAKDCSTLQDTWSFGPNTVRAGNTQLQVLGIGGGRPSAGAGASDVVVVRRSFLGGCPFRRILNRIVGRGCGLRCLRLGQHAPFVGAALRPGVCLPLQPPSA